MTVMMRIFETKLKIRQENPPGPILSNNEPAEKKQI